MIDNYHIEWLGYNNEESHDKIWGWLNLKDGRKYCFWGRRGKKLRFKEHSDVFELLRIQNQKEDKKGYYRVSPNQYDNLVKDFIIEVEIWLTTAILGDEVM